MGALIWRPLAMAGGAMTLVALLWAIAIHGPAQRLAGIEAERARALAAFKAQIEERNAINDDVAGLDDGGLCRALGGVFRDNRCE